MINVEAAFIYVLVFLVALILGSFYNVVALRTLDGRSLALPPSHCTKCKHRLSIADLFPVLSYLFLKGKCRYCGEPISPIYPIGELLTAISYTLIVYQFGFSVMALIQIVFITIMILATVTDLKETIVPDRFIVIGLILVLILRAIHGVDFVHFFISGIVSFSALFLVFILSKGKIGGADVKLYALIGLSIGWVDSLGSLFYASIIGLLFQIPSIVKNKGQIDREKEIPFVPFITLGILCTYIFSFFDFAL